MGRCILITKLLCAEDDLYSVFLSLHTADGIMGADPALAHTALRYIGVGIKTVTQGLTGGSDTEALSVFRSGYGFYAVKALLYVLYDLIFTDNTDDRFRSEGNCGHAVSVSVSLRSIFTVSTRTRESLSTTGYSICSLTMNALGKTPMIS